MALVVDATLPEPLQAFLPARGGEGSYVPFFVHIGRRFASLIFEVIAHPPVCLGGVGLLMVPATNAAGPYATSVPLVPPGLAAWRAPLPWRSSFAVVLWKLAGSDSASASTFLPRLGLPSNRPVPCTCVGRFVVLPAGLPTVVPIRATVRAPTVIILRLTGSSALSPPRISRALVS